MILIKKEREDTTNKAKIQIFENRKLVDTKYCEFDKLWYAKIIDLPYGFTEEATARDILLFVGGGGYLSILSWERETWDGKGDYILSDTKIQVYHPYD